MSYFIDSPTHLLPAATPRTLVEYLKNTSHVGKAMSLPAYMFYFGQQFQDVSAGLMLRTDTPDHFIVDLIAYGWLYIT